MISNASGNVCLHWKPRWLCSNEIPAPGIGKAKAKWQAEGEIETQHPRYLGAQDTNSWLAIAKLYTEKNASIAADLLNEHGIPCFDKEVPLLRILTDRGTEYCGKKETHAYQLYLKLEDVEHSKTKAYSPQTNGICKRFHKTMKNECYDVMFRRKLSHRAWTSSSKMSIAG